MTHQPIPAGRKCLAAFLAATLGLLAIAEPLLANPQPQPQDAASVEARVRDLYAQGSEIQVKLENGAVLRGRITRLEAGSFTLRQEKTNQETSLQYVQVTEVRKKGRSVGARIALIAAIAGGAALLVFCAAPFPIGFLCHEDPS